MKLSGVAILPRIDQLMVILNKLLMVTCQKISQRVRKAQKEGSLIFFAENKYVA